mmetsp:Transcript_7027/g.20106  ORF Transcript_7027/g.20106 Transcript_7027/m.20106 type:complete len:424 (+) Transcript_7027:287-1558(+)
MAEAGPRRLHERSRDATGSVPRSFGRSSSWPSRFSLASTALTRRADASALAPSSPMSLSLMSRVIITALTSSALPIAAAPSSPMVLKRRLRVANTTLPSTSFASTRASGTPTLLPQRLKPFCLKSSLSSVFSRRSFSGTEPKSSSDGLASTAVASCCAASPEISLRRTSRFFSTPLPDTYSATSAAPVGPMPQFSKASEVSLLRCRSTRTMPRAASSVRLLPPTSKEVNTALPCSASAIATAPSSRMKLFWRFRLVETVLNSATTRITVGGSPPSLPVRSRKSASTPAARFSPLANGSPISAPKASAFAHPAGHCHSGAPERRVPSSQIARAAKYSWKERCDDCSFSGSVCSKLSSGNSSRATRPRTSASASRIAAGSWPHAVRTSAAHIAIARPRKAVSSRPDEHSWYCLSKLLLLPSANVT